MTQEEFKVKFIQAIKENNTELMQESLDAIGRNNNSLSYLEERIFGWFKGIINFVDFMAEHNITKIPTDILEKFLQKYYRELFKTYLSKF